MTFKSFLNKEHSEIKNYLEGEFAVYLDDLDSCEFEEDDEKKFLKEFIEVISESRKDSRGKSQEIIGNSLRKNRSEISRKTERLNYFLVKFCKGKIKPPIQVFYYHLRLKHLQSLYLHSFHNPHISSYSFFSFTSFLLFYPVNILSYKFFISF